MRRAKMKPPGPAVHITLADDSDDDFVTQKDEIKSKRGDEKLGKGNGKDRAQLEEIGFGDCCFLNVSEIPSKFGHWVVESFDADRCAIRVGEGWVKIMRKRVQKILGIPRENVKIVFPTK
ncbi:hypothetical protein QQ045_008622 [Rhodiola kirilowii]